jgi:hypothetical protein
LPAKKLPQLLPLWTPAASKSSLLASLHPETPAEIAPLWSSPGVAGKPEVCQLCPFQHQGTGFVADWWPAEKEPSLGFLLDIPSSNDVVEQRPWSGAAGYAWESRYLKPFGLTLHDVGIFHVLRCRPRATRFGKPLYPTGKLRRDAEITCRQHDKVCWDGPRTRAGGLRKFNPNLFVTTFHPTDCIAVPALSRLLLRDVEKAVKKSREGNRVLVLMGDEAKELIAPWLKNSVKFWRGHWWRGDYPFGSDSSALLLPGFTEAA